MTWNEFLSLVSENPVIETEALKAGRKKDVAGLEVQLSRWVKTGRLLKLKRGVYLLAEPHRRREPQEFALSQALRSPSYVSLEKALEWHGLIPEGVPVVTSITTKSTATYQTPVGTFLFRHVLRSLFWGYEAIDQKPSSGFMAHPEKALLDLFHVNRLRVTRAYLEELRFQNTSRLDPKRLLAYARRFGNPALLEAAKMTFEVVKAGRRGEKDL